MRTLLVPLLLLVLTLNAHPALAKAGPFPPPPDLSEWSPGPAASYAAPALARDDAVRAPSGAASLRLDFTAPPHPADAKNAGDSGLACVVRRTRRDLSGARGLEFSLRADRAVIGRLTVESSNAETHASFDRFFGSFMAGAEWKTLRIPFRTMAPDPTWAVQTASDRVLRPDSVEEIRICVEADRLDSGTGTLWLGDIRFFR
jgi:hypothetical protein